MRLEVLADADAVARRGAALIAERAREAVAARGRFILALSGGETPRRMLGALATEEIDWGCVHIVQVDERVAPAGDAARNLTLLRASLAGGAAAAQVWPMPVEAGDLDAAAAQYAQRLEQLGGLPPVIDMMHLGLGADGHTASLVPGDAAMEVTAAAVAVTDVYQGRRRMTLTYPVINRARCVLWLVNGESKAEMFAKLCAGDAGIPAGRVNPARAVAIADRAAARLVADARRQATE